jgi:methyl-accepting chemotaxis protein
MRWFNNLNATPRLMISFGILMVLTLGIGYLAISSLGKANVRVQGLYQEDMKGVIEVEAISDAKLDIARQTRDGILNINDASLLAADLNAIKTDIASMHAHLQAAEPCFYTKEGIAKLAQLRDTLSAYESVVAPISSALEEKDVARAKTAMAASASVAAQMSTAITSTHQLKENVAEEKFQTNNQAYQSARALVIGTCVVSLIFGIILSIVISRGFSVPLGAAVEALEKVAGGDMTATLDVETTDEVGRMAEALNRTVARLCETLQEVSDSAASASSSSQQLAAASEAIASGAQEQASSLEETSASLEEITATVRQSADNAHQASQLASGSKDSAEQGQDVVSKAITAMAEINSASAKIADIISTIDEIAFQTNLLAVNAAVEAARAGEEGRGFAVVASEVRSLAQRTAVAAKEIKVLIQDSLRKVGAGTELVNHSGETLQGIVGSVKRVTDIVGEIAAAASEQSTGIEQVNTAMTQMDQVTQANSAQTEELSATAQSLSEQSAHLMELVSVFTLNHDGKSQRQFFQTHASSAQEQAAASSVVARPAVKAARATGTAKLARAKTAKSRPQPALAVAAAAPSASSGSDASFEEF